MSSTFLVDDIEQFRDAMTDRGVICSRIVDEGWGLLTQVSLPGGAHLGVYQPRHERPPAPE